MFIPNIYIEKLAFYKHQFVTKDRTLELYFAGCHHNCVNCQNKFLQVQSAETCKWITPTELCIQLIDYVNIAKQIHIVGGEPLEQSNSALSELCLLLKNMGFKCPIILFTGNDLDPNYINKSHPVFKNVDYVKYGHYEPTLPNTEKIKDELTGIELATTNQKIIKVI